MGSHSVSTSCAKVSIPTGVRDPGMKMIVEGGKRIGFEELKRSVEDGIRYFNGKRPLRFHIH